MVSICFNQHSERILTNAGGYSAILTNTEGSLTNTQAVLTTSTPDVTEILLRLRAVNAKKSIEYRHPDAIMRFCVVLQFKINSVIPPSSTRIRLKPASDGDPPLLIPRLSPDYSHTASVDPTRAMASLEKSEKPP